MGFGKEFKKRSFSLDAGLGHHDPFATARPNIGTLTLAEQALIMLTLLAIEGDEQWHRPMDELKTFHIKGELHPLIRFVMINRRRQRDLDPPPSLGFAVELQSLDQVQTGFYRDRLSHCRPADRGPDRRDKDAVRRQRSGYDRVDAASAQRYEMAKIIFAWRVISQKVEVMEKRRIIRGGEKLLPRDGIFGTIGANDPLVHIGSLRPSGVEISIVHLFRPA